STDFAQDINSGGAFTALDISPQLDTLISQAPELCQLMAEDFVEWMFPPGTPSRIPLFSVTGTNGKTTTCRMLRAISRQAGYRVGMACTDGIYHNDELTEQADASGRDGHHRILESRAINLAVLETARGAVLHSGFCFDHSDVAVCTNVTPEHLGEYGINTLEDMATIKQLIISKARKSVVLNFDDPLVRQMSAGPEARTCWTTLAASPEDIRRSGVRADRVLYLAQEQGQEWIMSTDNGASIRLLPSAAMPATIDGKARHNLSNAMQAIAAALEMGLAWSVIETAMRSFEMSIANTPGRLNFHHRADFSVLLDFVQNYACMERLCEFTDKLETRGKRILVMSVLGRHDDATVLAFARLASRHFDRFICRNYAKTYPHRSPEEIPEMLRAELIRSGVPEQHVMVELDEEPAVDRALKMATQGDLVVILCGIHGQRLWQQVTSFSAPNQT
ncbi:MAG TPA: Mur ligase family protein, partial [Xanthomonadales bacterium]|nr:Mur ligase family protein [Xanthomonadales bacterium]